MATKYYRGNNADWNTDAEWSTTSGDGVDPGPDNRVELPE